MIIPKEYGGLGFSAIAHSTVIVKIATHAVPFDLTPIPSGEPVRGVIELNDGAAGRHGLKTGDRVLFPAFSEGS